MARLLSLKWPSYFRTPVRTPRITAGLGISLSLGLGVLVGGPVSIADGGVLQQNDGADDDAAEQTAEDSRNAVEAEAGDVEAQDVAAEDPATEPEDGESSTSTDAGSVPFIRVDAWDALFARERGWSGTASAFSVDMQDGRVMWIFGPTWIGPVAEGRRVPEEGTLVANSVATHPRPRVPLVDLREERNGDVAEAIARLDETPLQDLPDDLFARVVRSDILAPPTARQIEFFAGFDQLNDKPEAWFSPDPLPLRQNAPMSGEEGRPFGWFVPSAGLVTPGQRRDMRLVLFMRQMGVPFPYQRESNRMRERLRMQSSGPAPDKVQPVGEAILLIERPQLTPMDEWIKIQVPNRLTIAELQAAFDVEQPLVLWGEAAIFEETRPDDPVNPIGGGFVYLLGSRRSLTGPDELFLVRAPGGAADWFHTWRFWNPNEQGPRRWTPQIENAVPILTAELPEAMHLLRLSMDDEPLYVILSNEAGWGDHIQMRFARSLTGPWSEPLDLFRPGELDLDPDYFLRSVAAHQALSGTGSLLLSYVIDSRNLSDRTSTEILRPRFIAVPTSKIVEQARDLLGATSTDDEATSNASPRTPARFP